jgi:hypothetical protein
VNLFKPKLWKPFPGYNGERKKKQNTYCEIRIFNALISILVVLLLCHHVISLKGGYKLQTFEYCNFWELMFVVIKKYSPMGKLSLRMRRIYRGPMSQQVLHVKEPLHIKMLSEKQRCNFQLCHQWL